tara:strand:+ start:1841 stop:2503 length:663 start_codon:yes stop_codon:yes gene_type:complete
VIDRYAIDFALTTYCQAKCRSCARTNQYTGEKEDWLELRHMNLDIFKHTLENSPNLKFKAIEFCGEFGDPMMHPEVDKFIETALTFAREVHISTNGGLRNKEWYSEIAKKYCGRYGLFINWAIDGADHDTNWKYREGVDWQKAMDNMTAYTKSGGNSCWWFLIFEWNWHQIPLVRKLAKEIGIENLRFRFQNRDFGLITPESRIEAEKLLIGMDKNAIIG